MGLTASFSNALSGLTAAARATDVVSSNISNALTEGHGRRELALSPRVYGGTGGVKVEGVNRVVDQATLRDLRLSEAATGGATIMSGFLSKLEKTIGDPQEPGSLSGRIARLDTALIEAATRPDSEARLATVVSSARDLTDSLNTISNLLTETRANADQAIKRDVDFVNESLSSLAGLNTTIVSQASSGRDVSALLDQRQALIDKVAEIVPVIEVPRDMNQVALMTKGGAILLDGAKPAELGFEARNLVTPDMSIANGSLSGLTLNGLEVPVVEDGILSGGSLSANFTLRDSTAPQIQSQLDALARNLIERFANPGTDPTLAPGAPGLFTDLGAAFDPADELGVAGRISINAVTDPAQGGQVWRIRTGLGALAPGDAGASGQLIAYRDGLTAAQSPPTGHFLGAAKSFAGLTSDLQSQVSASRLQAESTTSQARAQKAALTDLHLSQGVDTDAEMQKLLAIERSYAANARVIQSVEDMLDQIMRL